MLLKAEIFQQSFHNLNKNRNPVIQLKRDGKTRFNFYLAVVSVANESVYTFIFLALYKEVSQLQMQALKAHAS